MYFDRTFARSVRWGSSVRSTRGVGLYWRSIGVQSPSAVRFLIPAGIPHGTMKLQQGNQEPEDTHFFTLAVILISASFFGILSKRK